MDRGIEKGVCFGRRGGAFGLPIVEIPGFSVTAETVILWPGTDVLPVAALTASHDENFLK